MHLTRTSYIRLIRLVGIIVIVGLIAAYAIWRSLNYARGPAIEIFEPTQGMTINATTVMIKGRADRVNSLVMNGRTISIDESGNFTQTIVVFPGANMITFIGNDQFGRNTKKELDILGTADFQKSTVIIPVTASSSATSTQI